MIYKLGQLNIHDPHHSQKAGEILIQHSEAEESDLFILMEIDSNSLADQQFIKQFLEIAFITYEKTKIFEAERSLEKILQELNNLLLPFLPKKGYLALCHFFIGLYQQGKLFFSTYGKINVFLIKSTLIKKINIQPPEAEISQKIFDYTFSGQLKDNDKILITTESLTDYLSLEKIKKIVAALPPVSSVAHLTNILQSTPPTVSFFSIILTAPLFKAGQEEMPITVIPQLSLPRNSQTSLAQLLQIQEETEKILKRPSFFSSLKDKIFVKEKKALPATQRIKHSKLKRLLANNLWLQFKKIFILFTLTSARKSFLSQKQQQLLAIFKKFNNLSKLNKVLIFLALVFLLLLTQNLIWQSRKKGQLQTEQQIFSQVQQIEEKFSNIEASLIYNDTNRARQLLKEINQLLSQLPLTKKEWLAKHQELTKTTQEFTEKVWKITPIYEPLVIYNFKEVNLGAQIFALAVKSNIFYAVNSTNQLFEYNQDQNVGRINDKFTLGLSQLKAAPQDLLIGLGADKKLFQITPEAATEIKISFLETNSQIDDYEFYLDKMYLLDKSAKEIFRYTKRGNDYLNGTAWTKENLPIEQIVSLTVDGYVYALLENGEVLKMGAGRKQDFPKIIIEPQLTSPKKIYTDAESNYLYLLDPANKRFVIITKDKAELKNQYFSDKFDDLKDFIVDVKAGKVYLLNGSQLIVVAVK